jgi:hypothetical protein
VPDASAGDALEPGLPAHDAAFWADLAGRRWRRVKGRDAAAVCAVFGTPLHRAGTYYLRPVYTDGVLWLSQRGYEALRRRAGEGVPPRRYGRRSSPR